MLKHLAIFCTAASLTLSGAALADDHMESEPMDIPTVAAEAGNFDTLLAAVKAADLSETLSSEGPFTVFAPTDEAFGALPEGTLDELLKEENQDQLRSILLYHVVPGEYKAEDLAGDVQNLDTAGEQSLRVDGTDGVTVAGASVVTADVEASNGVIHVIDTVLLPQDE
jgi:uncharacterized surface protein with fasciclin (FAS1) repeats